MRLERSVAPPNSLLLVVSSDEPAIPASMRGSLIASTNTCIAVGTRNELDGETMIALTDESLSNATKLTRAFEGTLDVEYGAVAVTDIYYEPYLKLTWSAPTVAVTIWVNDTKEPDIVMFKLR